MNNILFLHIPKTAGTYIENYMRSEVFHKHHVKKRQIPGFHWSDYSFEELVDIQKNKNTFIVTHFFTPNNTVEENVYKPHTRASSSQESYSLFSRFKELGWFTFSFVRNPLEQICSMYFYAQENANLNFVYYRAGETLDQFCRQYYIASIPSYWKELDYIAEFNNINFSCFLKKYFNHDYVPMKKLNQSSNKGYQYYLDKGLISADTDAWLRDHENYKLFMNIRKLKAIFA